MKENKYDEKIFFDKYSKMDRSIKGLEGAGEWHELKRMLPDLKGKRVLDLGCGYGWHCRYAIENGAKSVIGVDISEMMIKEAKNKTDSEYIQYICMPVEDIDFPENSFDVIISSLTLHYVESFDEVLNNIKKWLPSGGDFVFSVEHPIFTAQGTQDWYYDDKGNRLHWPVDNYFAEGTRKAIFLGEEIIKYHKTLTTYLQRLIVEGLEITGIVEPKPSDDLLHDKPENLDELRRPMMLLISSKKK